MDVGRNYIILYSFFNRKFKCEVWFLLFSIVTLHVVFSIKTDLMTNNILLTVTPMMSVIGYILGRRHSTALRRRIVKMYDAAQRILKISDALSCRTIAQAMKLLRYVIALYCCATSYVGRRNAVLWPRPFGTNEKLHADEVTG